MQKYSSSLFIPYSLRELRVKVFIRIAHREKKEKRKNNGKIGSESREKTCEKQQKQKVQTRAQPKYTHHIAAKAFFS